MPDWLFPIPIQTDLASINSPITKGECGVATLPPLPTWTSRLADLDALKNLSWIRKQQSFSPVIMDIFWENITFGKKVT